jgi:hypothetical protein
MSPRGTNYLAFMFWIGMYGSPLAFLAQLTASKLVVDDALDSRYH